MEGADGEVSRRVTRSRPGAGPGVEVGPGVGAAPGPHMHGDGDGHSPDSDTDSNTDGRPWGHTQTFSLPKCLLCVSCGLVFGFAMEKGRIFEPRYIRNQMVLSRFVMLKMFLSAVATGMFGMSMLAMFSQTHQQFIRCSRYYYQGLADKGVLSCLLGGTLLGVGMVLSGSCPTSIFSQLGASLPNAGYTLAGGLVGTLLYGLLKSRLDQSFQPVITDPTNPWAGSPYFILALPLVAMFGILVCAFEILIPWTSDVKMRDAEGTPVLQQKAWPPYYSGVIIGSLQVPLLLGIGHSLGGSSSLLTLVSQVFVGPVRRLSPFLSQYRTGFTSWWQIFYVGGVILGSYLSASMSGTMGVSKGVPLHYAFWGGLVMMFGTRLAGGCTSGHGLSGLGFLSILSFLTMAAMFISAICTALVMQSRGLLQVL